MEYVSTLTPHKVLETVTVNSVRRQVGEYIFNKCELFRYCPGAPCRSLCSQSPWLR